MKQLKRLTQKQKKLLKELYGVKEPSKRFGVHRVTKDGIIFWDKLENKAMDPIRI
ncbi:hypothetical protein [Clostridium perfringens]|uniref:hypothetical protein n=1 Tax=Clostridium perfringens TaxID=1502 RepID=UPI0013E3036B|nr:MULTISPECIES: hypothetical protein [Clostridium]DAM84965.1 MAG TPA: hypothetical protein [Caudoviricetes sp.]MDK0638070.1 hypothetical protein [Clostridium perfringens]MDK0698851.1 hypothetical protein [Clostridium perfringens]MDK0809485.1 hypothetical protein [Clostridium perfringens]MDM0556237.1 hypothetical protein [Clostridium perfringens]